MISYDHLMYDMYKRQTDEMNQCTLLYTHTFQSVNDLFVCLFIILSEMKWIECFPVHMLKRVNDGEKKTTHSKK